MLFTLSFADKHCSWSVGGLTVKKYRVLLPLSPSCPEEGDFPWLLPKMVVGPVTAQDSQMCKSFQQCFCEELQPWCLDFVNLSSYSTQEKLT